MTTPRELLTAISINSLQSQTKVHALNPDAVRNSKSLLVHQRHAKDMVDLQHIGSKATL